MYLLLLNSLLILLIGFNESNGRALDSSKLQKRIISGEDAKLFQIPYVAAVTIRKDNAWYAICTGVLVTENKYAHGTIRMEQQLLVFTSGVPSRIFFRPCCNMEKSMMMPKKKNTQPTTWT
uniref:Peptidase S1 domain-containing protein n=1 Tax=Biomphalaria glabrata TaxID=6526 RepID=A0A2C9KYH3_BIOGL